MYAALNPILRGLGFDGKQVEYQRGKLLSDKGVCKVNGDRLYGWRWVLWAFMGYLCGLYVLLPLLL